VTHSSGSKVASSAPNIPHNGNTQVSDNLNVTKIVTASAVNSSSDIRLKTNVAPLPSVLENVLLLRAKSFQKKLVAIDDHGKQSIHSDPARPDFGLIAQEAREIFPQLVYGDEKKEFLGVAEGKVGILLLAAFQEYVAKTDARIAALEAKLSRH
jgi:hypothetical protein